MKCVQKYAGTEGMGESFGSGLHRTNATDPPAPAQQFLSNPFHFRALQRINNGFSNQILTVKSASFGRYSQVSRLSGFFARNRTVGFAVRRSGVESLFAR
jgi:hypothetical protein